MQSCVGDNAAASLRPLFAAALQCALHAHCNAAQLLQIQDAMLQILDVGWGAVHCCGQARLQVPSQPICNCIHCNAITPTVQSSNRTSEFRNSRDTKQQKCVSTSASNSCKQLQPRIAAESVSLIMQSRNTCQAAVTGQPQPCNWSCKCKPHKVQCNSRAGRSKQGAKGHRTRFGCGRI